MREGWKKRKLIELANVSTGKWDANHATERGKYRFYTCAYDFGYCNTNRFSGESIILPGNGVNVGEVFYYDGEFDAYQRTYIVNNIKVLPRYLYYHMQLHWKEVGTKTQYGSATNFIKIGNFQDYDVEYPGLEVEQKRIVEILDEAFAAIDKAKESVEKNLQNAKELFESYLHSVFANKGDDWQEKKLGDVCEYDKTQNTRKDLPYVGLEHIESNTGRFLGLLKPQTVKSSTFFFTKAHVLYGRLRPYLNKVLLPDFDGHCSTEIFPIKVSKELDRRFLFYWLTLSETVKKIDSTWTGARMPRANMNLVIDFEFHLPPLKEQHTIVKVLDRLSEETRRLKYSYEQKLSGLEELKKSILQKAFSGELTSNALLEI